MLASNSAATFHQNLLLLDRGLAEFSGSAAYCVVARNLRVETPDPGARIRVGIDRQNRVLVASLGGSAEVRNAQGRLVAHVASGASLMLSAMRPEAVDGGMTSSISTTTLGIVGGVAAARGTLAGLAATGVTGGSSSVSR